MTIESFNHFHVLNNSQETFVSLFVWLMYFKNKYSEYSDNFLFIYLNKPVVVVGTAKTK